MKIAHFAAVRRLKPALPAAIFQFLCACTLGLGCAFAAHADDIFKLDNDPKEPTVPAAPQPEVKPAPGIRPAPTQAQTPTPAPGTQPAPKPPAPAAATPPSSARPAEAPEPARSEPVGTAPKTESDKASKVSPATLVFYCVAGSITSGIAVFLVFFYGMDPAAAWMKRQEDRYDRVLRQELLLTITPRHAFLMALGGTALAVMIAGAYGGLIGAVIAGVISLFFPGWILKYLIVKRLRQLNTQLPDGLTSLSSGVRAGLNLVQSMQLLARNTRGPIQQEFSQILREYEMGLDLNQAMRNASNRIGSPLYRLTFTAIEMHRIRGGDSGESMDRIAESVREIQRLEGKLDAVTSESRAQAAMLSFMPVVIIGILMLIAPDQTSLLFTTNTGKITLVLAGTAILFARRWIHDIMQVDI